MRQFSVFFVLAVLMAVIIMVIGAQMIETSSVLGFTLCIVDAFCLILLVIFFVYLRNTIFSEIQTVELHQAGIQKSLMKELPIPYILTDDGGDILWYNKGFSDLMGSKAIKSNISQIVPTLYKKVFPDRGANREFHVFLGERKYCVICRNVIVEALKDTAKESDDNLLAFYFFDETQLVEFREESKGRSMVAGLIYIDNYEEVLENMEEVRQSLLLALVERKIVKYMQNLNAIIKRFEKDKFIFVFEEKNLEILMNSKFSLLDEVREINIGNDLSVTLSISVGVNAPGYLETYESARIAMDLALGRGGDQAVVRDGDTISYYGGKTQKVEKSTRVKARVKAHALREIVLTHDRIFIMGHKNPDADCVGAALGMYRLAKTFEKEAYIVMDRNCPAIEPIISGIIRDEGESAVNIFISGEQALQLRDDNSMLIVVDVNIPGMTECPELLKLEKTIVVLDHHRQTNDTIRNAVVSYVEPYASSSCEMAAEILQYIPNKLKLKPIEADAMYSGILVDTDNFVIKAGVRTFEAAAYLRRAGADVTRVRKMFREDMEHCRVRTDIINHAEIYMKEFAISTFDGSELSGATVVGAKAANSLLDIQGIRGSFVLTQLPGRVYISARSIDDLNVQTIMEKFHGGGHLTMAAAQLTDVTLEEAVKQLKELLSSMKEEGDI